MPHFRAVPPTRPAGRRRLRRMMVASLSSVLLICLGLTAAGVRSPAAALDLAGSRFAAAKSSAVSMLRDRHESRAANPTRRATPSAAPGSTPPSTAPATASSPGAPSSPATSTPAQATATASQATATASGQQAVASAPVTIAADCSRDVTGALNAWMQSIPGGSTVVFAAGACYRVDGTLRLHDRHDLTIDGSGARFEASVVPAASPKTTRQMLYVVGGSDITIRNLVLKGTNPRATFDVDREWHPLIQIAGTRGVLVERVSGSHSWGDFVSIGPDVRRVTNSDGTGAVLAEDVTVRASTASVIGRHAITCNGCENVLIDQNSFSDVAYQILDVEVEAHTWHAKNVAFTDNTIGGKVNLSVLANAGIGREVTNITVSGNVMTGTPVTCAPPIQVDDTSAVKSGFVIRNNRFKTLGNALWLRGVSAVTVEDNVVSIGNGGCTDSGVAVVASNGERNVVRNNDFTGARTVARAAAAATGTACGNKLTGTAYNQPQLCPAA